MAESILLSFPVIWPILAGIALWFVKSMAEQKTHRRYLLFVLSANLLSTLLVCAQPDTELVLLHFGDYLPFVLKIDALSRLFCVLAAVMFLLVGTYSLEYMEDDPHQLRFHGFYLMVLGFLAGAGLAGNLVTLYFFIEGITFLSLPLVIHNRTPEATAAAFKYLIYSLAGSALALIGIFIFYTKGIGIEFVPGGHLATLGAIPEQELLLFAVFLAIVGFGVKAAMFPLHAWLPTAHPVAPTPSSAVLSGVITKAGVLAIIRFVFYIAGAEFVRGTWVQYTWITLVLISIIIGSVLAYKEQLLKKRFAYSSVSQVSYILLGLASFTPFGVTGALLHIVFHSIAKNGLFLFAGALTHQTGKSHVYELKGIGRQMPISLGCFLLLSLSVVGIPPAAGFLSKWHIAVGSLAADVGVFSWLSPVVLLISALFSAGYLFPIVIDGFFPGQEANSDSIGYEAGGLLLAPIAILSVLSLGLGVFSDRLITFLTEIISGLL